MTARAIFITGSFLLSGTAMVLAWQTARYARQARERAAAAYVEIKRSRGIR